MAEKINIDIIINAAQSAKTLKEQKDALNQINKALDEVKQGSGAFELLSDSANELKASMDTLTLSFEDVYGSGTKPLTAQMGELEDRMYAMAIAGQQNTQEFKTLQQEAIKMRKTIIDVDESVDAFAQKGARLQGFIGVVQGIAGGFAVASSASKLFSGENERLQQSIEKTALVLELLSGLEAINTSLKQKNVIISGIQNGIRKVTIALVGQQAVAEASAAVATGTATTAQKALNAAMSANPIGLIIVAIGTLIGLYYTFSDSAETAAEKQKKLNEQYQKDLELSEKIILQSDKKANAKEGGLDVLERELELLKAKGATELEINLKESEILKEQLQRARVRYYSLKDGTTLEKRAANDTLKLIKDLSNSIKAKSEERKRIISSEQKTRLENGKKEQEEAQKEIDRINSVNKAFSDKYDERQQKITDTEARIRLIRSGEYIKTLVQLDTNFKKEIELVNKYKNDELILLREQYKKKEIDLKQYTLQRVIIDTQYFQLEQKLYEERNLELEKLENERKVKAEELQLSIFEKNLEFELEKLNKQKEIDKKLIENSTLSTKEKNKAIENIESEDFDKRKQYYKNYEQMIKQSLVNQLRLNLDALETQKTQQQQELDKLKKQQEGFNLIIKNLNEDIKNAKNDVIKEELNNTKKKLDEELTSNLQQQETIASGIAITNKKKEEAQIDYNLKVQKLASDTTDKLGKEEEDRTQKTKEETEKRINDTIDFVTQSLESSLNLLSAIFNQISEQRISNIEREKDAALQAIQDEEDAYIDSTEKKTNAEKFKEDKQNEFARKREEINAKYDRERNEAEYKNQVIQWEFAYGQAVVNLAGALIKSAPNPFLLATTGVLGTIQLATMLANRPVKRFAKGGLLEGKSHAEGGISTPFGEMEGGEAVINKKSTKQYLPILSAINEAGGGVPLVNMPKMASGGLTTINNMVDTSNIEMILEKYFDRPIKTYVTTSDISNAQSIDNRLTSRTTF